MTRWTGPDRESGLKSLEDLTRALDEAFTIIGVTGKGRMTILVSLASIGAVALEMDRVQYVELCGAGYDIALSAKELSRRDLHKKRE